MQSKSNNQYNKNVGTKPNNQTKNNQKNVNHMHNNSSGKKNQANKNVVSNQKVIPNTKKNVAKVEILDLNIATPEIETELPVKNEKVVPILEPDKNPTIVIPVVSTDPVTQPETEPVTEVVTEPETSAPVGEVTSEVSTSSPVVDNVVSNPQQTQEKKKNKILMIILIAVVLGLVVFGTVFVVKTLNKEDRTETLNEIDKSDKTKFTLGEEEFYLGETVSSLKKKGLTYEDELVKDTDYIVSDSIAVYPFYYEGEAVLLGALYCPTEENCKYDDAILIKANFYDDTNVVIDDFVKVGLYYDDIKDEYGKKDGKFYQDKDFYVWTFGEDGKIGEPYYLLRFNSNERLEEIRIGVWWYEEEFEYTVK